MLDRTKAPEFREIGNISLIEPLKKTFSNGLPVYIFQSPEQELVRIEWIFENVYLDAQNENPLLNSALSALLKEGTITMSSAEIADKVDFYGAFLVPEYSFDVTSLSLYTLNRHSQVLLPLVKDILTEASIPQQELDTYLRNNKQKFQVSMQKNDYLARRKFYNSIFGENNRYGRTPKLEDYDAISRSQLVELYKKEMVPSNCTLIVSGNVSESLIQELEQIFGAEWQGIRATTVHESPVLHQGSGDLVYEEKENALQSAIRLGYQTISRTHPDYPALQFVNTLLGGFFGSRLMRNIREEKGYTYSIGSAVATLKHTGFLTIVTEVGVDVTHATLQEIEKEVNLLKTTLASDEEVELVKTYMEGSMLGSLESIFSHADKFKSVALNGMTLTYYTYYMDQIRQMSAEKVRDIANTYLDFDKMVKVIVGKISQMEPIHQTAVN
ncbi:insulinase family protein [Sphingobacterium sp. N143]|uniref:M16 family metallopeptidase n=1 Tax=Sphingobacterium sp. N143 TaxID=2746727 RepID=UPI0025751656|nr:pitrilysin family protein [Sphingobacterium sp. N143]MDM1296373.1 insulinase family protein [Sphingobacterium sp. N143]